MSAGPRALAALPGTTAEPHRARPAVPVAELQTIERPQVQDSERVVLGTCLSGDDWIARARARLRPEDFDLAAHRLIFESLGRVTDRGDSPDLVLVHQDLNANGDLERTGAPHLLTVLLEQAAPHSFDSHVRRILEAAQRRRVIALARTLQDGARDPNRSTVELITDAREGLDTLSHEEAGTERLVRAAMSGSDFLKLKLEERPSLLGAGVIGGGTLSLIHGKPGTGKTFLALQLAVAVARGEPWHSMPTVEGGARVGVLELELPPDMLQKRLRRIAGDDPETLDNVSVLVRPQLAGVLDLSRPHDLGAFRAWIERKRLAFVILDALGRTHSLDQNAIGPLLNALDPVLRETGCGLLVIHHDRKGGTDPRKDGDDLDEARGDSRLTGDAATTARIVRHGELRCLRFTKTWSGPLPDPVWFRFGDGGLPEAVPAPERVAEGNRARVERAVIENPRATRAQLEELTGLSKSTVASHLKHLDEEDKVRREGTGYVHTTVRASEPSESSDSDGLFN